MTSKKQLLFLPLFLLLSKAVDSDVRGGVEFFSSTDDENVFLDILVRNGDRVPVGGNYSEHCNTHLLFYQESLRKREVWALTMFDASTKIPEGIMASSLVSLGNFDECVDIRDVDSLTSGTFHGKHFLTSMVLNTSLLGMSKAATIKIAVCLPSSCNTADVVDYVNNAIGGSLPFLDGINARDLVQNVSALDRECHTKDQPELQPEDWAAVGILSFFVLLVALSTGYDIFKKESRSKILLAFSLITNGKKLLATSNSADTLNAIHGIRFLSIAWVVMGHRYIHGLHYPVQNALQFEKDLMHHWKNAGMSNAPLSVDSFFLLSGLLVSYVFFKKIPKTKCFNIPMFYIHRYLRLTPALAAMALLQATLLRYSGSGPLWETQSHGQGGNCEKYWWIALLYVQNYVKPMNACVIQSWYLAVDMQLHWLSPLVLIPLWKWPRLGAVIVVLLSVGGIIGTYFIAYDNEFPASYLMLTSEQSTRYQKDLGFPVYTRFIPYLVGVGTGYLLVKAKNETKIKHFSKMLTLGVWLVAASLMLLAIFPMQVFQDPSYEFEPVGASLFISLQRPLWSLGLATLIYLCSIGHGGPVNTLLSWNVFQPLSRLSYCIYLTHISIQLAQYGSARSVGYLSGLVVFPQYLGDMVLSVAFGAALSLVFETPFVILENELLGKKKSTSSRSVPRAENAGSLQHAA